MIEAHTLDAWTRDANRDTAAFRVLVILGGFAAPLFLWLAGLSVALASERSLQAGHRRRAVVAAGVRRGLEIFALAFLFRIQAFVVSPGNSLQGLLRVDILNILGPSIALCAVCWGLAGCRRVAMALGAATALALAMATPLVLTAGWVDLLPAWLQWYLAARRRADDVHPPPVGGFRLCRAASGRVPGGRTGGIGEEGSGRHRGSRCDPPGARLLGGLQAGNLPGLLVLDQLADLLRHPRRCPDAAAGGAVGACVDSRSPPRARAACAPRAALAVRLLDSRRAGLRLRELAASGTGCRSPPRWPPRACSRS